MRRQHHEDPSERRERPSLPCPSTPASALLLPATDYFLAIPAFARAGGCSSVDSSFRDGPPRVHREVRHQSIMELVASGRRLVKRSSGGSSKVGSVPIRVQHDFVETPATEP